MWGCLKLLLLVAALTATTAKQRHGKHRFADYLQTLEQSEVNNRKPDKDNSHLPKDDVGTKYTLVEHDIYDELKVVGDECTDLTCGLGKRCLVDEGGREICVCAEPNQCPPGHKIVCGSDGNLYESHCRLHRTACIVGQKISIDRSGESCFQKDILNKAVKEPLKENHVMSKKKDLSQSKYVNDAGQPQTTTEKNMEDECSPYHFQEFKHLLKIYHCNRMGVVNCDSQDSADKRHLVAKIFKYYDRDSDEKLTSEELTYAQSADHMDNLAHICSLSHLLVYSPAHQTGSIDVTAFYQEFGVDVNSNIEYKGQVKVTYVTADGYRGVALTCDLADASSIRWKRNDFDIDFDNCDGLSLMPEGTLYITAVNLQHTGNYTCYNPFETNQVHLQLLVVQVAPVVRSNQVGHVLEGATTSLRCHSDGVPPPSLNWQVFDYDLPRDKDRYYWDNEGSTINILRPSTELDSGQYQCVAKSDAGLAYSMTEVKVMSTDAYIKADGNKPSKGVYLVFHANGYTSYEAEHCYTTQSIEGHASDFVSNLQSKDATTNRLCSRDERCVWGSAVSVKNKLVYAAQPTLNRIVIIDVLDNFRPKHVVIMEHSVHSLYYVYSTDEIWALAGTQPQFQTALKLNDVSLVEKVTLTPLVPHRSVFDSVDKVFAPQRTSFNRTGRYGYTSHFNQYGLNRVDTTTMAYDAKLTLMKWECQPSSLHQLAIGGLALIECNDINTNLVLDMLNNVVVRQFTAGRIYVSPNTRYIVIVTSMNEISVHYLHDNATIELLYHHKLQMAADQLRFMESKHSSGYDLAVTSPNENAVLFMDLKTRKTEMLEGFLAGRSNTTSTPLTSPLVVTSDDFGEHILLPSRGALFIVNKLYHSIACEWTDVSTAQLGVWLEV